MNSKVTAQRVYHITSLCKNRNYYNHYQCQLCLKLFHSNDMKQLNFQFIYVSYTGHISAPVPSFSEISRISSSSTLLRSASCAMLSSILSTLLSIISCCRNLKAMHNVEAWWVVFSNISSSSSSSA